jgi:hypothetical protein
MRSRPEKFRNATLLSSRFRNVAFLNFGEGLSRE